MNLTVLLLEGNELRMRRPNYINSIFLSSDKKFTLISVIVMSNFAIYSSLKNLNETSLKELKEIKCEFESMK